MRHVRVGDVLRLERTRVTPDPAATYRQIGIYSWGKGIIENEAITGAELSKVTYYRLPPDALVLSNIQAWEAAIAFSEKRHAEDFIASQRFLPYVPVRMGEVDARYLLHFFLSDVGMALIRKASPGTVTRNRTLGINAFESLTIPLPGIEGQREISARLDRLSAALDSARASDIQTRDRGSSLRQQLIEKASGSGPSTRLGDFLTASDDSVKVESDGKYPNVGLLNWGRGLFKKEDVRGSETSYGKLCRLRAGQVVYSKLFAWEGSVTIVPALYEGYLVSSEFPRFDVDDSVVDVRFLGHLLRSNDFVAQLRGAVSGMGQRRQRVNPDRFLNTCVRLPELGVQTTVADRLDALDAIDELRRHRSKLAGALPQAGRNEVFSKLF
jgi:type I restriction enzyme S subunit